MFFTVDRKKSPKIIDAVITIGIILILNTVVLSVYNIITNSEKSIAYFFIIVFGTFLASLPIRFYFKIYPRSIIVDDKIIQVKYLFKVENYNLDNITIKERKILGIIYLKIIFSDKSISLNSQQYSNIIDLIDIDKKK